MKVLPKTSSSDGTSSFGVIVLVTDNFEGSSPGRPLIAVSSVCRLYDLLKMVFATDLHGMDGTLERGKHCDTLLYGNFGAVMLSRRHRSNVSTGVALTILEAKSVDTLR